MARVSLATPDKAVTLPAPAPGVTSKALLYGDKDPIHTIVHSLTSGSELQLNAQDTDIAVFVWKGAVIALETHLHEQASIILERGTQTTLLATQDGASVVAFFLSEAGIKAAHTDKAAVKAGGHIHILPHDRVPRTHTLGGTAGTGGALHADAQCPTCSVWLHENTFLAASDNTESSDDAEIGLHSHSEDEVIFVYSGSMRLGNRLCGPGTALGVAANTVYGFTAGPDGLGFVNFRASSPTYTTADGKTVMDEAELWRRLVGRPEYL